MDRPNDKDYRNLEERNAAYWREQADKLAEALTWYANAEIYSGSTDSDYSEAELDGGDKATAALAEYNASK
jgi:hypothetical protein